MTNLSRLAYGRTHRWMDAGSLISTSIDSIIVCFFYLCDNSSCLVSEIEVENRDIALFNSDSAK